MAILAAPPIAKAGSPGRKPISPISSEPRSDLTFRRKHYGRRKGPKLRARQAGLLETLLPRLALTPERGRDPQEYFPAPADITDVWLEIGFGAGEHLAWQAAEHPKTGIIGAEPYVAGMAKLLAKIADSNIANIRLYTEDARDILGALPDGCLGRVFILFPDPWPKSRHHKRRFIQMKMLDELARVMRSGAELRFATDDQGYLVWALERLMAHPSFNWTAEAASDWGARAPDWPETRYEAKAKKAGRACAYLRFARV
jgi:tRNA (guanine-N7-)-methyltransferase